MERPLFRMNEHGDMWQELELFDQADLAAAGDANVTRADYLEEHRAVLEEQDQ